MVSVTTFTTSSLWRSVARRTPTDRTVGATPLAVAVIAAATQNRRPVVPDSVSVPTPDTVAPEVRVGAVDADRTDSGAACPTKTPEPHLLGEFPMTCYRCH